jgi:putative MATE family efflux protein
VLYNQPHAFFHHNTCNDTAQQTFFHATSKHQKIRSPYKKQSFIKKKSESELSNSTPSFPRLVNPNPSEPKPATPETNENNVTKGVKTLLGDPKKAIIKLSIPMIIAMTVQTLYNLVDALWVSGLGPDALAAVGFVFPFFFMALAISTGLGVGGGAAISRRIGAQDKKGADKVAIHSIILAIIVALSFTIPFFVFAESIFAAIGAGSITPVATLYARIIASGSTIIFFSFVANAILRAEGDAKRAMFAMALGGILNIIIDPIFIYTLELGVAGAAWATLLSMTVASLLLAYWLFFKKDTYVTFHFRGFRFKKEILKDILRVGLPASFQQLSMSIMMLMMNIILVHIGGTDGVAVFSAGWRVVTVATLPLLGIATGVVSVTGAAYGSRDYYKLNTSYLYAVKIGFIIETTVAIAIFLLAPFISAAFTQAEASVRIAEDLTTFLQIVCLFIPGVAFGMLSSAMFQGTTKGINALIVTLFRTIILAAPLAWIFSTIFSLGLPGAWWGIVVANLTGSFTAFTWGKLYVNTLKNKFRNNKD